MENQNNDKVKKILLLLKIDSHNLFERIILRRTEYLRTFSFRRTRSHFKEIFYSRYKDFTIDDLQHFGQELIVALNDFYKAAESIEWYLNHTEDMPGAVEDKISKTLKEIEGLYLTLEVYLNAELEGPQS